MALGSEHDYKTFPELTNSQIQEFGFSSPHMQITEDFVAIVVKVHDGDTITLQTDFRDFKFPLRLAMIDAPEMNAGGQEAKDWLSGQILNQEIQVKISRDNRVGKYGRLLGRVFFAGLDLGEAMMRMGMVVAFGQKNQGLPEPLDKIFSLQQWF